MKKTLKTTVVLLTCIVYLWIGLSYAEVVAKNAYPNPNYSDYNAIGVFLEYANAN